MSDKRKEFDFLVTRERHTNHYEQNNMLLESYTSLHEAAALNNTLEQTKAPHKKVCSGSDHSSHLIIFFNVIGLELNPCRWSSKSHGYNNLQLAAE
jgi:hypothetical protein